MLIRSNTDAEGCTMTAGLTNPTLPSFTADQIARAIAVFPHAYHADFATTREAALAWHNGGATTKVLADRLERALVSWGAGRRKAPLLRSGLIVDVLDDPAVRSALVDFESKALMGINSVEEAWYDERPDMLYWALHGLNALFVDNDSVTYPTKALLLLTGRYVGLDSNVRKAIAAAGIAGFKETRFPMPVRQDDRNMQRLTLVLGLIGAWLREHEQVIAEALSRSATGRKLQELNAPARVLDICLFVVGSDR